MSNFEILEEGFSSLSVIDSRLVRTIDIDAFKGFTLINTLPHKNKQPQADDITEEEAMQALNTLKLYLQQTNEFDCSFLKNLECFQEMLSRLNTVKARNSNIYDFYSFN